jgi:predicted dehydrogenase
MRALLVGGGNITQLRHIPALRKLGIEIGAVVGKDTEALLKLSKRFSVPTYNYSEDEGLGGLIDRLGKDSFDFALVGSPPTTHFAIGKELLEKGIGCLIEKPFCLNGEQGRTLLGIAKRKSLRLGVMHNFANSRSFLKAQKILSSERLGKLKGIELSQFSSMNRRIPSWIDDLPFGLFFDEAAHFVYIAENFAGAILPASIAASSIGSVSKKTPAVLSAQMISENQVPISMHMTFDSPISEWGAFFVLEKGVIHIDLFRDIIIVLRDDGQHRALDILRTSFSAIWQHVIGFIASGTLLATRRLHYGVDVTIAEFLSSSNQSSSADLGIRTIERMQDVVRVATCR